MEDRRQRKSVELLASLEEMAQEKGLKLWLSDNIREVKRELEQEASAAEVGKLMLRIDEILHYMREEITPKQLCEVAVDDLTTVSVEDIQERLQEIIEECETANELLCRKGAYSQQEYIRETERKIRDINNVDAFYDTVCSGERFSNYFHQAGSRLNLQMQKSLGLYVEEVFQNYNHAMGKIKGLFFHIKDETLHVSQRKFYQSWENKHNLEKQTFKAKAESMDSGGEAIGAFGQKHSGKIKEVIERLNKKKRKYMWRPFLVVTAIFVLISAVDLGAKIIEQRGAQQSESTEIAENADVKMGEKIAKIAGEIKDNELAKTLTKVGGGGILLIVFLVFVFVVLPFLLLVVFLYKKYISLVKQWYKKWVCAEVETYLGTVINELIAEGEIQQKLEAAYLELKEEIKIRCRGAMESILNNTQMNGKAIINNDAERFLQICLEWENIKREA